MAHDSGLQHLLNQFAAAIGLDALDLDEEGLCALRFSGTITVEMSARDDQLLMYSDLGAVPNGTEETLYPALLQANLFWQSTHGATLSITDDLPPRVVLACMLDWSHHTAVQFERLMEQFVDAAENWMGRISASATARLDAGTGATPAQGGAPGTAPERWDMLRG